MNWMNIWNPHFKIEKTILNIHRVILTSGSMIIAKQKLPTYKMTLR